jgi:uncharacterized protein (DUF1800 family)
MHSGNRTGAARRALRSLASAAVLATFAAALTFPLTVIATPASGNVPAASAPHAMPRALHGHRRWQPRASDDVAALDAYDARFLPLAERMTLFWHNHFVSAQDKVPYPQLLLQQDLLLRRDALGHFGDMLHAVAKDPAMLIYLDGAGNRKERANENFAREVMELFTLGEGHYTQQDVSQAARAYTGWSVDPDTEQYVWRANFHDYGEKTVFGRTGNFDGDTLLDMLLARAQTATFITAKLWREFVSPSPDPAQLAPIADAFGASDYDIKVALRGLFLSDAFWASGNRATLVKSPAEFVVGTLRQFDVGYDDTRCRSRQRSAV